MLFGHEDKIRAFKNLVKTGNLGQAYLFFGDAKIGKCLFARALAGALELGKLEPSLETLIDSQVFSSHEKNFLGVEAASDIKKFLWATPLKSSRRVAIIDDAHVLTPEAQSALLKIVEETPPRAIIIFITYDPQALFPPLLSRLIRVYFPRLSQIHIKEILQKNYNVASNKAEDIAKKSFGRVGRALDLLNNKSKSTSEDLKIDLEEKILSLRNEDLLSNSNFLLWLLEELCSLNRYNLNLNLQKKAISHKIYSSNG